MPGTRRCLLVAALLALGACTSGGSAMLETARQFYSSPPDSPARTLDPSFRYLRASLGGRELFLALGYVDALPAGPTEVWYSGTGEVIRMRNGRIVGTTGLATDWRTVRFSAEPGWGAQDTAQAAVRFSRERDLMPGYRTAVHDAVRRIAIPAPPPGLLRRDHGPALRWFEERSVTTPAALALPPARFAVADADGRAQVVYSQQCIAPDLCLSLERWTAEPAAGEGS